MPMRRQPSKILPGLLLATALGTGAAPGSDKAVPLWSGRWSGCALSPPPTSAELQRQALLHTTLPARWIAGRAKGGAAASAAPPPVPAGPRH